VGKGLGREKSDIRKSVGAKRHKIIRKLEDHQKLIQDMQHIHEENERDARFLP
jgi:hypothetical protein